MKREDVITKISERTGFRKQAVSEVVNAFWEVVLESLARGECVKFTGFGSFELKKMSKRLARNPRTNEPVDVPERCVPTFKPGKLLKDGVNNVFN